MNLSVRHRPVKKNDMSPMELENLLSRLALALGIGLLFGLERGWRQREAEPGSRAAGIRTFGISGLLGGVIGALAMGGGGVNSPGGAFVLGAGFAVYSGVLTVFGRDENRVRGSASATGVIAGMLVFALGAFAVLGDMQIAAASAVAAAGLLALRKEMHGWVESISWPELRSLFVLLAMTFIALPIMPSDPVGPFGGVNPREVWIIALVLAAVSFFGYAAVKYFGGRRGLLLSSFAGGLASSTAVTVFSARAARAGEAPPRLLAAAVSMASAVMFLRVVAIVAALNPVLLPLVTPALLAAALFAFTYALVMSAPAQDSSSQVMPVRFRNPFDFFAVVGFALFLGVIIVLGRAVGEYFGAGGAILGAAAVGIADVDSVAVSVSRLVPHTLHADSAALAILAAVATDTLSKIGIGAAIGRGRFAAEIAAMAAGCLVAGGLGLWGAFALLGWSALT
jgi:uncharacterized membrane protein (DUF4010 family)